MYSKDESPMTWELKIKGCYFQDHAHLKKIAHVDQMYCAIQEAREMIFRELKSDSKQTEEEFLNSLLNKLWVDGIEW